MPPCKKYGRRYPWREWFARGYFALCRGKDYTCRTPSMAQLVYQAARRAHFKLAVKIQTASDEQSLTVRVLGGSTREAKSHD